MTKALRLTDNRVASMARIPESLDDAGKLLADIDALVTRAGWARAALVYAFTEDVGHGGDRSKPVYAGLLSCAAFARKRIPGLMDPDTVRAYRKAWQQAIDDGVAEPIGPGDVFAEPQARFEDYHHISEPTAAMQTRVTRTVLADPDKFAAALEREPRIAQVLAQRALDTPAVMDAIYELQASVAQIGGGGTTPQDIISAVVALLRKTMDREVQGVTVRDALGTVLENPDAVLYSPHVPTAEQHHEVVQALMDMRAECDVLLAKQSRPTMTVVGQ